MNDNGLRCELVRNSTGYFLVIMGLVSMAAGAHWHIDKLVESGAALMSAALLAFQARRPDGSVPPPPPPPPLPPLPPLPTPAAESITGPKGQENTL